MIAPPDRGHRIRCRHRDGDPNCACWPECPDCGETYDPEDGHRCADEPEEEEPARPPQQAHQAEKINEKIISERSGNVINVEREDMEFLQAMLKRRPEYLPWVHKVPKKLFLQF